MEKAKIRKDFLDKLKNINVWHKAGSRAPHKPLLLLLALSKIQENKRLMPFDEIYEPLKKLLAEFGPPQKNIRPQYPFWRLKNDGIWDFTHESNTDTKDWKSDPSVKELIKNQAKAGFPSEIFNLLKEDKSLIAEVIKVIIDCHFPESLHEDILYELSLKNLISTSKRKRDSSFRAAIIQAYEHRCAICGCDLMLEVTDMVIEAAHIKWFQAGGPDIVQNGLALCALHHKAFDRGAISLTEDYKIMISADAFGQSDVAKWFVPFNLKGMNKPYNQKLCPNTTYIQWHQNEVFRWPMR